MFFILSFPFGFAVCGLCWCFVLLLVCGVSALYLFCLCLNENSVSVSKKKMEKNYFGIFILFPSNLL